MRIPKAYALPFLFLPLALAVLAWLISTWLVQLDEALFNHLVSAAHVAKSTHVVSHHHQQWINSLVITVICATSFLAGFYLRTAARMFAGVQIIVFFGAIRLVTYYLSGVHGHPIADALTILMGAAGGYAVKLAVAQLPQRFEAQYYELMLRNQELQEARMQLIKQDEVERRILAGDLHDQVLNDLKAVKQKISESDIKSDSQLAVEMDKHLSHAMEQVQDVMDSLCPSVLDHLGLVAAVEDCIRRGATRAGIKMRFKNDVAKPKTLECLSRVDRSVLFRLVQESVNNICKHAQATMIKGMISLKEENKLAIMIEDDGTGMKQEKIAAESRGLRYMRLRADLIGATIGWRAPEAGSGTVVEINIDLTERINGAGSDH